MRYKPSYLRLKWTQLPSDMQQNAQVLGYTSISWDRQKSKMQIFKTSWTKLQWDYKLAAFKLGWNRERWDRSRQQLP